MANVRSEMAFKLLYFHSTKEEKFNIYGEKCGISAFQIVNYISLKKISAASCEISNHCYEKMKIEEHKILQVEYQLLYGTFLWHFLLTLFNFFCFASTTSNKNNNGLQLCRKTA
jgi:hypothetical protein